MRKALTVLMVSTLLTISAMTSAQVTAAQQKISDRVLDKIQTIELYNQIMPVLLTPAQIRAMLTPLERYRLEFRKLQLQEHELLKDLEPDLDASLTEIKKKETVPDRAVVKKYYDYLTAFNIKRRAMYIEARDELVKVMKANLNSGQIAAAANSFNPPSINGETDPKKFTEDMKLIYWIDDVLFDPLAYDILIELSRKK